MIITNRYKSDLPTWIHIGLSKTGTTTLQHLLFARHQQILYLGKFQIDRHPSNMALTRLARSHSRRFDLNAIAQTILAQVTPIHEDKRRLRLISEELLAESIHLDPAIGARRMHRLFPRADILLVIRDPIEWLQSMYFFLLSRRFEETFDGFPSWVNANLKAPMVGSAIGTLQVGRLAATYAKLFGAGNLKILNYERFRAEPEEFVGELCHTFGIDRAEGLRLYQDPKRGRRMRPRVTEAHADFLRQFKLVIDGRFEEYVDIAMPIIERLDENSRELMRAMLPADYTADPDGITQQLRKLSENLDKATRQVFRRGPLANDKPSDELRRRIFRAVKPSYQELAAGFGASTHQYFNGTGLCELHSHEIELDA